MEHAIPTLFRSGRVVISGDEKQMPPTSFFSSRIGGERRVRRRDARRRRHRGRAGARGDLESPRSEGLPGSPAARARVLPSTTLQIHYRSKYRELIGYSNSAFYKGELSARPDPDAEIRRMRPIEVVRGSTVYEAQTNAAEADKIVELLASLWSAPPEARPSVGVVTFKQAGSRRGSHRKAPLTRPSRAPTSASATGCRAGEDMGFFVKNVENVQGDERDVIIFSTTFGRDRAFRRNFGVLGQTGGSAG